MNRQKIVIDIDGVLADTIPAILKYLNPRLLIDKITDYNMLPNKYGQKFWDYFNYMWEKKKPNLIESDSPNIIKELMKNFEVEYLTGRSELLKQPTEEWIKEKGLPELTLNICSPKFDKRTFDFDYLLDDNPRFAYGLDKEKILFLFQQPWNKGLSFISNINDNIVRIKSLKDVIGYFRRNDLILQGGS